MFQGVTSDWQRLTEKGSFIEAFWKASVEKLLYDDFVDDALEVLENLNKKERGEDQRRLPADHAHAPLQERLEHRQGGASPSTT